MASKNLAKRSARNERARLARLIRQTLSDIAEDKYTDIGIAYTQVDRGGILTRLTDVSQGTAQSQRVGDGIRLSKMEFRASVYYSLSAVATNPTHMVRLILFRWNQDSGSVAPSLGTILQTTGTLQDAVSPYYWNRKSEGNFSVIYDKMWSIGSASEGVVLDLTLNPGGEVRYNNGAITGTGHIYALIIGDDVTGAHSPSLQAQFYCRTHFSDS